MTAPDPTKRIPKTIGTDAKLLGRFTLTDLTIGLFPGVLVVLATQVLLPADLVVAGLYVSMLALPLTAASVALGLVFVFLTPPYTSSLDWLTTLVGYHRSPKRLAHEEARAYTQLERVHPEYDAIERTDGALIGMVRLDPPIMALATDDAWARAASGLADMLNTVIDFPVQLYATTRRFPVETYLARYEARLEDPDVKANPRLARLIREYVDWYAGELDQRRMTIRDHYVVVPVSPAEVRFEHESLVGKLAGLPLLGIVLATWRAPREAETFAAMVDSLDEHLRQVEAGLRGLDGCSARRVDATEATRVIAEFWTGESLDGAGLDPQLRTRAILGGDR